MFALFWIRIDVEQWLSHSRINIESQNEKERRCVATLVSFLRRRLVIENKRRIPQWIPLQTERTVVNRQQQGRSIKAFHRSTMPVAFSDVDSNRTRHSRTRISSDGILSFLSNTLECLYAGTDRINFSLLYCQTVFWNNRGMSCIERVNTSRATNDSDGLLLVTRCMIDQGQAKMWLGEFLFKSSSVDSEKCLDRDRASEETTHTRAHAQEH